MREISLRIFIKTRIMNSIKMFSYMLEKVDSIEFVSGRLQMMGK